MTTSSTSPRIVVSGASGFIGSALCRALETKGCRVERLCRAAGPRERQGDIAWNPSGATIDAAALDGAVAVVHLAGESVAQRWTPKAKERIRRSRVEGTALLCGALASLTRPPKVLVSASAIGYYGDRGSEELTEESGPGQGFLSEVCEAWEAATQRARDAGIRVAHLRLGIVLDPAGGALRGMLRPFRLGLGGPIGSGRQYMSWITRDDLVRVILFLLFDQARGESIEGPVNAVAPGAVTNAEFARALGRAVGRPAFLRVPAWAARLALGEMGRGLLLSSARVAPVRLVDAGFEFENEDLESALRDEKARTANLH